MVTDITDKNKQREIVTAEHNRVHKAARKNIKQIIGEYYFPKITILAQEIVANCKICTNAMYDRYPKK